MVLVLLFVLAVVLFTWLGILTTDARKEKTRNKEARAHLEMMAKKLAGLPDWRIASLCEGADFINNGMHILRWNTPFCMLDIDVPDEGHTNKACVTFQTKEEIIKALPNILNWMGTELRGEVYETPGGIRIFITSQLIAPPTDVEFCQLLVKKGVDPFYIKICHVEAHWACRMTPKVLENGIRKGDYVARYLLTHNDHIEALPELEHLHQRFAKEFTRWHNEEARTYENVRAFILAKIMEIGAASAAQ